MRRMGSITFTAVFAGGLLALAPITRGEAVSTSEDFQFSNAPASTGVVTSGSSFNQGTSSAETEATYTGNGAPGGNGYLHSTIRSVDGLAPTLHVYAQAQGEAGSDWISSSTNAVLQDSLTLSGPDASKVAQVTVSAPLHVVFTGSSPKSNVIDFDFLSFDLDAPISQSGDYIGTEAFNYTGQTLSFTVNLFGSVAGYASPDATHSNFVSIDATFGNHLTPNGDGTFTESGPFLFTFYDADGNPLTDVTATGSSGISYTATRIVTPEPASLALLACAAVPLLSIRRRRSGVR